MCCCKQKTLGTCGWVFTLIYGLLGIACIVLAALTYDLTNFNWSSGTKYQSLGVITLIAVCVVIAAMVFGFIEFCKCQGKCCYGIIYLIIQAACALFTFGISIFGLVAGTMGKVEDYVNCDTEYTGILTFWKNMDYLFTLVDMSFCSNECKCYISDETEAKFKANSSAAEYIAYWKYDTQNIDLARTFADCPLSMKNAINTAFQSYDKANGEWIGDFDIQKFSAYWAYVEDKFNCTGFCKKNYPDPGSVPGLPANHKGGFYKYLFSGVNKGVVEQVGCLNSIINWLSPILLSYGVIAFVCSLLAIWTWLLSIFLLCNCYKKEKDADKKDKEKK